MPQAAAEMARRLALILSAVAALIARRFLRDPKFAAVIVPLWGWLGRSARRFERAVTRPMKPRPTMPRRVEARTAGVRAEDAGVRPARVRLPGGQGWLVKALGWEAAGYGSQLTALLAEPEMQAVLAAVPAVGRILRPVCRMLGVVPVGVVPAVRRVRKSRPPKVRMPRFSWKRAWAEVENRPWPTVGPALVRPRPR